MRIPPSVIVMSLVTAVPFALAVHDTMKPHTKTVDEMTDDERAAHFEEEMRLEAAQQAQRDAAETAKREAVYKTLFGSKPAQIGSFFGTLHLGMPADDPGLVAFESAEHEGAPLFTFADTGTADTLLVHGDEHCDTLHTAMVSAWQDSPDGVYLDPASHQRASYHDCMVTFDRYIEVNQWIDKKGDVPVALSMIGMSAEKLRDALGSRLRSDDGEVLMWSAPGIGRASGQTRITASVENGKITAMTINVETDAATFDAVHARLDGLIGKGAPNADDPDLLEWKGKLPARLSFSEQALELDLGQ